MRIWNWIKGGLAALGMMTVAVPAAADSKAARPALWKVADEDTSIYLFGTVHLLPANYQWRTPAFDKATNEAGTLVVETIIDDKNPAAFASELARLSIRPGLPPLVERVPPEKREALRATVAKSGVPIQALDNLETWAAAFMLLQVQFQQLGLTGSEGVENVLRTRFAGAGKPIEQLETNSEQLGFFDALPESAQREMLEGAIEDPATARKQFDSMLGAWSKGDVDEIARTFNAEFKASPALKEILLERRNANWSRWLESRMAKPGTVFVAVGAGHLAGDESVIALLKKRGMKVERVQ